MIVFKNYVTSKRDVKHLILKTKYFDFDLLIGLLQSPLVTPRLHLCCPRRSPGGCLIPSARSNKLPYFITSRPSLKVRFVLIKDATDKLTGHLMKERKKENI